MSVRRISSAEAERIAGAKISYFDSIPNRKADVKPGQYYAIIADSPDRGIIVSDRPIEGFAIAIEFCRIGKASEMESTVCMFYSDRTI